MFCNLTNRDQPINSNQYNVAVGRMSIFLRMDLKYSKKKKCTYIGYSFLFKFIKNYMSSYFILKY